MMVLNHQLNDVRFISKKCKSNNLLGAQGRNRTGTPRGAGF